MSDVFSPPERVAVESHCKSMDEYRAMHKESVDEPHKYVQTSFSVLESFRLIVWVRVRIRVVSKT